MIRHRGYAVAVVVAPLVAGAASYLIGGLLTHLLAPLDSPRILKLAIDLAIVFLICGVTERIAIWLMLRALGDRADVSAQGLKTTLRFWNRNNISDLNRALLDASASPASWLAAMGLVGGLNPFSSPELMQEAAVLFIMLGLILLAVAYATMISGWKRCNKLLDSKEQ